MYFNLFLITLQLLQSCFHYQLIITKISKLTISSQMLKTLNCANKQLRSIVNLKPEITAWLHLEGKNTIIKLAYGFKSTKQKSHYEILGLTRSATLTQIKKKYYEMAKIYHPDVSQSTNGADFNRINIAYQVLSDQAKKKQYDQMNPSYQRQNGETDRKHQSGYKYRSHKQKYAKGEEDEDPFMAYDDYFKSNRIYNKAKRGGDININLTISFQQSIKGVKKQVCYSQQQLCPKCVNTQKQICFTCGGKKTIFNRQKREKQTCNGCDGKGFSLECDHCFGTGYVTVDTKQSVIIGRNTQNKNILRVEGLGHHGFKSDNGDLYVTVFVEESDVFRVDGNNVYSDYQLDYVTATLGGTVKLKTVYGETINVLVQPGTQSGKSTRLFNYGLTSKYSKRKGDYIITFRIKVPSEDSLTQKQKLLLKQLNL